METKSSSWEWKLGAGKPLKAWWLFSRFLSGDVWWFSLQSVLSPPSLCQSCFLSSKWSPQPQLNTTFQCKSSPSPNDWSWPLLHSRVPWVQLTPESSGPCGQQAFRGGRLSEKVLVVGQAIKDYISSPIRGQGKVRLFTTIWLLKKIQ